MRKQHQTLPLLYLHLPTPFASFPKTYPGILTGALSSLHPTPTIHFSPAGSIQIARLCFKLHSLGSSVILLTQSGVSVAEMM